MKDNYLKLINEMLSSVKNEDIVKAIYIFVSDIVKEDKECREGK